jgi:hypothetical protein
MEIIKTTTSGPENYEYFEKSEIILKEILLRFGLECEMRASASLDVTKTIEYSLFIREKV